MQTQVHIEYMPGVSYPQWNDHTCYAPAERYPELFQEKNNTCLSKENKIYEMVRNTLAALGLDKEHFGTKDWNPLADFVEPGNTVLVKPNMVNHVNRAKDGGLDCLVTHPSVVRAVLDYVVLALRGSGRILLADAPVQSCNFEELVHELHYDAIVEDFKRKGTDVILLDLRQLSSVRIERNGGHDGYAAGGPDVEVDMGSDSAFGRAPQSGGRPSQYRITNYLPEEMERYHKGGLHRYSLAGAVMEADVIINLPKPKTHRKAGITASVKNMVGCVAKKECLPHHTKGSKRENGDEYLKPSFLKRMRTDMEERNNRIAAAGGRICGLSDFFGVLLYKAARILRADTYVEGSWYGNDTLWRTVCDICRIVLYADKEGKLMPEQQRKMFVLADMVIAGEGEGPLCPQPKAVGILVGGWEQIAADTVIAALMGYCAERFPTIANADYGQRYRMLRQDIQISSNSPLFQGKKPDEIRRLVSAFKPTSGWREWLEEEI